MNYLKIWRNFFKLNEKYSVMYATTDRDTSKLLNIIEIHVFSHILFGYLQYLIPPTGINYKRLWTIKRHISGLVI